MTAFDQGWGILKASRRGRRERDRAHKERLVDPSDPFSEFKDKPGGGHKDEDGRLINPFYRIDRPFERDKDGSQEHSDGNQVRNLAHHWEPSKFSNIMDLSDYPTPASHRAQKKLEKILSGRVEKTEKFNKETGLKEVSWKPKEQQWTRIGGKKPMGDDIHKFGLKHGNEEMLGRQALEHLHSLGLEASRHKGHLFIKMPGEQPKKGDKIHGPDTEHHFYMPVVSHNHATSESWPDTISGDKKDWRMYSDSQDPHTLRANRWSLHSTGRRSHGPINVTTRGRDDSRKMFQNHFLDYINLINPYHKDSILSHDSKLDAANPEKGAKKRFEKQYWKHRDAEQKGWQESDMEWPKDEEGNSITNPDITMSGMGERLQGLIENELHAARHWWEDPRMKAKDIKQKMPYFWHFSNLKWAPKHEQLPKKWWKNRGNDIMRLTRHLKEGPPHPSMQPKGTFTEDFPTTESHFWNQPWQDKEVQAAGPGTLQPRSRQTGGPGLAALDAAKQPSEPSPWIPPPNKRRPVEDVLADNPDVNVNVRRAEISPLEGAFDSILKFFPGLTGGQGLAPRTRPEVWSGPRAQQPDEGKVRCSDCGTPFPISDIIPHASAQQGEGAQGDALRAIPEDQRVCRPCRQFKGQSDSQMTNYGPGVDASKDPSYSYVYTSKDRPRHTGMVMVI